MGFQVAWRCPLISTLLIQSLHLMDSFHRSIMNAVNLLLFRGWIMICHLVKSEYPIRELEALRIHHYDGLRAESWGQHWDTHIRQVMPH
jgi:hypothetical protein